MRTLFDSELNKLTTDLTKMGHLVELAIENMVDAFKHQDKTLAKAIMKNDHLINEMQRTIESRAFSLMLCQQPMASDLRNVTSALKIVTDLERIGDQAADIAEIVLKLETKYAYRSIEHIPAMAKKTKRMVHEAIDAFIKQDLIYAQCVIAMDDEVDALFCEVKQEVIDSLKDNNEKIDCCLEILMIAKYLERIGDHAVNICEWVEFNQMGTVNDHRLI